MNRLLNILFVFLLGLFIGSSNAQETNKTNLRDILGKYNIQIIENSNNIPVGTLKVVAYQEAQDQLLKGNSRIVGYPIIGKLSIIDEKDISVIKSILLNDENYISIRARCKNEYLVGVRFTDTKTNVEFALGMPCKQAIWGYRNKTRATIWGSNLNDNATSKFLEIISTNLQQ